MALSLDDKLLGEKIDYYCSSSEDEDESPPKSNNQPQINRPNNNFNTGPKGVIEDWNNYKKAFHEKRLQKEQELRDMAKKLSLTCRPYSEDERERKINERLKAEDNDSDEDLEFELEEFYQEYRAKRIQEMRQVYEKMPSFGVPLELDGTTFTQSIDNENPNTTVIIHLYSPKNPACEAMNGCLFCLAKDYVKVKFCRITCEEAKLSEDFSVNGVPALLVYRGGNLLHSFVKLSDELGCDFFAPIVENFLFEHAALPARENFPPQILNQSQDYNTID